MSLLTILIAMNLFFGGPSCEVEYRLMADPAWYELDTSGIDWTVSQCHVTKDGVCLTPDQEQEAYDSWVDKS